MGEQTPSQAEGERDDEAAVEAERGTGETRPHADAPRPTPSQAEGGRDGDDADEADGRPRQG
ncbi:hypothetical protein [Streptomyces sp. CRN 30]|uniref:hypothetical protein n=1 Tax=Streptomyces sp. CRN 30 TaxID=3075613 RepID=UPI002A80C650|nr:hypothetical protein [Streptomyces sp. CRN 30]